MDRTDGKLKIKRAIKNGLTYGLALEVIAIGGGYLLYREYKSNQEFREKVEDQFPQLTEAFNAASGIYLSAMPKRLRDKILVDESDFPTSSTNPNDQTNSTTSTAPTASTAQK